MDWQKAVLEDDEAKLKHKRVSKVKKMRFIEKLWEEGNNRAFAWTLYAKGAPVYPQNRITGKIEKILGIMGDYLTLKGILVSCKVLRLTLNQEF